MKKAVAYWVLALLILGALVVVAMQKIVPAQNSWRTGDYTNSALGFTVAVPSNWSIVPYAEHETGRTSDSYFLATFVDEHGENTFSFEVDNNPLQQSCANGSKPLTIHDRVWLRSEYTAENQIVAYCLLVPEKVQMYVVVGSIEYETEIKSVVESLTLSK